MRGNNSGAPASVPSPVSRRNASRSERADAVNLGSGPGERIVGGANIKRILGGIRAQFRLKEGSYIASNSAWEKSAPYIGFALVNADYIAKTRAATDLTQTLRVLAIVVREGNDWKLVQAHWSHGGPVR